jgi:hypothetical protein
LVNKKDFFFFLNDKEKGRKMKKKKQKKQKNKTNKPLLFSGRSLRLETVQLPSGLSLSMYGGSSKLARGGGVAGRGTGAKRPHSFPLPPPHRPSGPGPGTAGRLSLGGRGSGSASIPRSRGSGPAAAEETFSLVAGNNPLAFAMIIRLAPDLVDEIKRVEAQDGTPRIKFDASANNSAGNVSFLLKFQLGPASFVQVICTIWLCFCFVFFFF